ncbi:MAG: amidohydrolase family protein [Thermodesulfobacteriota bacterium]
MIRLRKADTGVQIHRAGWVLVAPNTVMRDGYLLTAGGVVQEVGQGRITQQFPVIDHGPGALLPVLVNGHTHLELSLLQGMVPFDEGFQNWVRELIRTREEAGPTRLTEGAKAGIEALKTAGCGLVGEVSSLGLTRNLLYESGLAGVWFREYLGGDLPADASTGLSGEGDDFGTDPPCSMPTASLAGHGPHTTAPEVLKSLKDQTRTWGLPFGLHLDESEDELEFLTTGKGPWADFLKERGIDFETWGLPAESPVAYADRLGLLDERTLAVHLIHSGINEFEVLRGRGARICLCPRSNAALHGRLPDLAGMLKAGLTPCLGTDSLASVDSLSLFDEMAFTARSYPEIAPETILSMATFYGAEALGLADRFGSLEPNRSAVFTYLPATATTSKDLLEQLVHGTFLQN